MREVFGDTCSALPEGPNARVLGSGDNSVHGSDTT